MTRRLLLLPVVIAASGVLLSGCGGSSKPKAAASPAPKMPAAQAPSAPVADPKPLPAPAAKMLQSFLRGIAADDTAVCKDASAAYNKAKPCKKAIKATYKRLKAKEIKELKGVEAVKGMPGPKAGEFAVMFTDLKWTKGALPQGLLADQYVLGKVKGKWLIVG